MRRRTEMKVVEKRGLALQWQALECSLGDHLRRSQIPMYNHSQSSPYYVPDMRLESHHVAIDLPGHIFVSSL